MIPRCMYHMKRAKGWGNSDYTKVEAEYDNQEGNGALSLRGEDRCEVVDREN